MLQSISLCYSEFYESIITALKHAANPLVEWQLRTMRHVVPGWVKSVKIPRRISIEATQTWRESGSPTDGPIFALKKLHHRRYKYAIRRARRNENRHVANKMAEKLIQGDGRNFWKDVRKVKGVNKVTATSVNGVTGDSNICNLWKEHYSKLFNCFSKQDFPIGDVSDDESAIVTYEEIIEFVREVNITKSPGPDGISAEYLKNGPPILMHMLALLFTTIFIHGKIPSQMLDVHLVPVVKDNRGQLSNKDNYRPIAMATCVSKVLEICILKRIESCIETVENQFGFKKCLGTDSCIFVLKEIIHKFKHSNTNTFLAFLDASKAFDRVRHDVLFLKLKDAGVPLYVIRVLKFWYTTQLIYIKWNTCLSESFTCTNGVKQGGVLSPYLFNFYLNKLSTELNEINVGCCLNMRINHLLYADDLVLIAPTANGIQKLMKKCETYASEQSIQFNIKKSKLMVIKAEAYKNFNFPEIKLNDLALETVSTFNYLGHVITNDAMDDGDIMRHCRYLYTVGNSIIRKFYFCDLHIKLKLFSTYCGNAYTGHLWQKYNAASLNKVRVAYNCILRKLLNIPRHVNGVSYSASGMFAKYNVPSFPSLMRRRYYGFAARVLGVKHSVLSHLGDMHRMGSCWWSHYRSLLYTCY